MNGQDYLLMCVYPFSEPDYNYRWDDQPDDGVSGSSTYYNAPWYQRTSYYGFICEWDTDGKQDISNSTISFSKNNYIYDNGRQIKPGPKVVLNKKKLKKGTDYTVSYKNNKSLGKATATITGCGKYKGTKTVDFYIIPQKVKELSVKSDKASEMYVQWGKYAENTGYQISYSKKSNFSIETIKTIKNSNTINNTFKNLEKGKKYYVRVRGYYKTKGKTLYGSWSPKKSIKITKETSSIELDKTSYTLNIVNSNKVKLTAKVTGPSKKVTWKSSDKSVVTVKDGVVTAQCDAGTATITATANGKSAKCKIKIQNWTYITKTLKFSTADEWQKAFLSAKESLLPITEPMTEYATNKKIANRALITEAKTISTKTIKASVKIAGEKKTFNTRFPETIRFKVYIHRHVSK